MGQTAVGDVPSRDEPYDPDMTVQEALDLGLIAVIDTATLGRHYSGMCGVKSAMIDRSGQVMRCSRDRDHKGVHAFVVRWQSDWEQYDFRPIREQFDRMKQELKKVSEQLQDANVVINNLNHQIKNTSAKREARIDSMVYGISRNKKARFRETGAGKVRK